jgi:hypothetical protein
VGIASGRTPAVAEPILGQWTRRLWLCLEQLGWQLHMRHTRGHTHIYFNDMADHWANAGCTVEGVRAAWEVVEPPAVIWENGVAAIQHPLMPRRVEGLETGLVRCLRASLHDRTWETWVLQSSFATHNPSQFQEQHATVE